MRHSILNVLLVGLMSMLAVACTSRDPLLSRLDEPTGLTVVTLEQPLVLARPTRLAVAARDYAYVGPVEINRNGRREHYLWVGLASTLDRARLKQSPPLAESLALLLDGAPMVLPLKDWEPDLEAAPYAGQSPVYAAFAARASLAQIERIAAAGVVEVRIVTAAGAAYPYRHWSGDFPDWAAFTAAAPDNP